MCATIQDLPAEIIQLILQHSLPLPGFSTFPQRYPSLLNYSLVCKQWTPLAHHLLYSQLHFPSPLEVDAYLTATCAYDEPTKTWGPTPRGIKLADLAKAVWFGGGKVGRVSGTGETERMMKVLVLLVNLRVVWARDLMPFALEHFTGLKIERLHLDRIKMITPYAGTPQLLLPHLKQLHLSASCVGLVDLATGGLHAHSPTAYITAAFPPLEAITLDRSFQFEPSGDVAPIQLPPPGAEAAVKSLRIDATLLTEEGEPVTDWQSLLPKFTTLKRLALSDPTNLLDLAAALPPSSIATLEVLLPHALAGPNAAVDEINYDLKIMSALLTDAPGFKALERVVVSACVDERGRRVGDGRTRASLAGRCAGMGVELVERPFGPDGDENRFEWVGVEGW